MIEFYCLIPSVVDTMPIIPSREHRYAWYDLAVKDLKEQGQAIKSYTARCPGIIDINQQGWIQRTYQDIWIKTEPGNRRVIIGRESIDQRSLPMGDHMHSYVNFHGSASMAQYRGGHDYAMDTIIKIQSPWKVRVPDGYSLLSMPIPYPDDQRFTAAHGTIRGENWLNVQLFWHATSGGEHYIPKGTPLQQYILIKDQDVKHHIRAHTTMDQI